MKLRVVMEHEIEALTDTLCGGCRYAEPEWPLGHCQLFERMREKSETEGFEQFHLRLPECRERAQP